MLDPFVNGRGILRRRRGRRVGNRLCAGRTNRSCRPTSRSPMLRSSAKRRRRRTSISAGAPGARPLAAATPRAAIRPSAATTSSTSTYGFAGGMDYHVSPYDGRRLRARRRAAPIGAWRMALGTGRSDALQVGAYGITWFGPAYLAGALSFSQSLVHHQPLRVGRSAHGQFRRPKLRRAFRGRLSLTVSAGVARPLASRLMAPCRRKTSRRRATAKTIRPAAASVSPTAP